jgi:Fe-S-cluster-containing hydrogenase component 2
MKFDMPSCGGCRSCELACSFHWRGEFVPAASSLKIVEKDDGPGYAVLLKQVADDDGPACDLCAGLDIPLCMEYCKEYDDLYMILQKFKAASESPKDDTLEMEGVGNVRR